MALAKQLRPVFGEKGYPALPSSDPPWIRQPFTPLQCHLPNRNACKGARSWLKAIHVQCHARAGFRPNETGTVPSSIRLGRA